MTIIACLWLEVIYSKRIKDYSIHLISNYGLLNFICYFLSQYYSGHHTEETIGNKKARETMIFFLNCLCLLLGRLDSKKIESTVSEYGTQISQVLLLQVVFNANI